MIKKSLLVSACLLGASFVSAGEVDKYGKVSGVSGSLTSIGSDTLNNLMALWSESFKALYPNVKFEIEGKGSSTAPPALIEGTSQLGPMSRAMKDKEMDAFEKAHGYKPTPIRVAIDALAVFAHKDNPIKGLTMDQVDGIFSSTLKSGSENIKTWGEAGLKDAWSIKPISLYGRNSASGTYGYFKKVALLKGDYKKTVKEQPGSSAVIQGIASDISGLGYSGIGYITSGVRALPLGESENALYEANFENCLNGNYPLARFLYVYVNKKPGEPLDSTTAEYIKFILSAEGQAIVAKDGYFPLTNEVCLEDKAKL